MYQLDFGNLSIAEFLRDYWQQKPVLIKGGFKQFQDPLTADELAGLALDENVESRVVSNINQQWDMQSGPFEDFAAFD